MTVQELLEQLKQIIDRDKQVAVYIDGRITGILDLKKIDPLLSSASRCIIRTKSTWLYDEDLPK